MAHRLKTRRGRQSPFFGIVTDDSGVIAPTIPEISRPAIPGLIRPPVPQRYSRFCELYRGFAAKLPVVMRQTHSGGEKLFVDYAGDTVPVIVDRLSGESRQAQIFVAVLGASSFSYAEATWTQSLPDWIAAHVHAFEAVGGVPRLLVPDNTKAAVIKACLYDPQVNRTYSELASHY